MHALVTYLLSAMMAWAPLAEHDYYAPEYETEERYNAIAHDLAEVALDPNEPPLFGGPQGREQTAMLMAAIAFYESGGYRRDVDLGVGARSRGDSGKSWCLMQINIGAGMTRERWTGRELVEDRHKCFHAGLARIRESFALCRYMPLADRLTGYTKGRCERNEPLAHRRMGLAMNFWAAHPYDDESARTEAMAR
jgi:hypothetical protein